MKHLARTITLSDVVACLVMLDLWLIDLFSEWDFDGPSFLVGMLVAVYIIHRKPKKGNDLL